MKQDFFEELKKTMLSEHKEDKYFLQYVRYYETMIQNQATLEALLSDMKDWKIDIHFVNDDEYGYGKYEIWLWECEDDQPENADWYDRKFPTHHYEIELNRDERYWGYCECTPDMEGYNEKRKCCGNGCDWVAPSFTLRRIEEQVSSFKGSESDIWKLEEKWTEHLDSYNEKIKEQRLKRIEDELTRLTEEKEKLLST